MKEEIKVPNIGESITEVTIGTFLKENGAYVAEGDEIVELETEKVNQVLYAPKNGRLEWKVKIGHAAKIGEVIGTIFVDEEAKTTQKSEILTPEITQEKIAPKKVEGETRRKMSKVRKVIATRLVEALRTSAMLTTFNEVDMSQVIKKREEGTKIGITAFFLHAVGQALAAHPDINSYIEGDEIVTRDAIDIGIAVGGAKGGLIVPVIRNCDRKSPAELDQEISALALKAREGKLSMDEVEGGGFTITNGGIYGSLLSTPILNPPQAAILGMHKIEKRAVVVEDQIVIRPMMYLALSYDHRLIDGKEAVGFLVNIKELIEQGVSHQ